MSHDLALAGVSFLLWCAASVAFAFTWALLAALCGRGGDR